MLTRAVIESVTWRTAVEIGVSPGRRVGIYLDRSLELRRSAAWCINWMFVLYAYHVASRTWRPMIYQRCSVVVVESFVWMLSWRWCDWLSIDVARHSLPFLRRSLKINRLTNRSQCLFLLFSAVTIYRLQGYQAYFWDYDIRLYVASEFGRPFTYRPIIITVL